MGLIFDDDYLLNVIVKFNCLIPFFINAIGYYGLL